MVLHHSGEQGHYCGAQGVVHWAHTHTRLPKDTDLWCERLNCLRESAVQGDVVWRNLVLRKKKGGGGNRGTTATVCTFYFFVPSLKKRSA